MAPGDEGGGDFWTELGREGKKLKPGREGERGGGGGGVMTAGTGVGRRTLIGMQDPSGRMLVLSERWARLVRGRAEDRSAGGPRDRKGRLRWRRTREGILRYLSPEVYSKWHY